MKIDLSQVVKDLKGRPQTTFDDELDADGKVVEKKVDCTLRHLCVKALSVHMDEDKGLSPKTVHERWQLAGQMLAAKEPMEMALETRNMLRKRIAALFAMPTAGPAIAMLDGDKPEGE